MILQLTESLIPLFVYPGLGSVHRQRRTLALLERSLNLTCLVQAEKTAALLTLDYAMQT